MIGMVCRTVTAVITVGAIIMGCAMAPPSSSSDYPLPTTASILPLQIGNQWTYRFTIYDGAGNAAQFPDHDMKLEITGAFYMVDSGPPMQVDRYANPPEKYARIVYKYEWESFDSGYLVYHQGTGDAAKRGLYLAGTYVGADLEFFDTARLWYAFPGDSSMAWRIDLPGGDTASSLFECISIAYRSWFLSADAQAALPAFVLDSCYCYRQTVGDEEFYRVFHPEYGQISMRYYKAGILRESYILAASQLFP